MKKVKYVIIFLYATCLALIIHKSSKSKPRRQVIQSHYTNKQVMHNRKKLDKPLSEAEVLALSKKCELYSHLVRQTFERRHSCDTETLSLLAKMLKMNPDFYSLWNFRREILLSKYTELNFEYSEKKFQHPDADIVRDQELFLSAEGIQRNPKSYGAWYHRVWIIRRFNVDLEQELQLCKTFLLQDQRNFHCWNYRRYVLQQLESDNTNVGTESFGSLTQKEFDFSEEKIRENFSNYSAFHHRSIFLQRLIDQTPISPSTTTTSSSQPPPPTLSSSMRVLLPAEFAIVENAVFTEPDDQSVWWYHQFLLTLAARDVRNRQSIAQEGKAEGEEDDDRWLCSLVVGQVDSFSELLTVEARSKWLSLGLLHLLDLLRDPSLRLLGQENIGDGHPNLPSPGVEMELEGPSLSSQLILSLNRLRDLEILDGEEIAVETEDGLGRLGNLLDAMRDRLLKRLMILDPMHRGRYRTL